MFNFRSIFVGSIYGGLKPIPRVVVAPNCVKGYTGKEVAVSIRKYLQLQISQKGHQSLQ